MSESREPYTVRPTSVISMTVEDWDKLVADTRREALLEACDAICPYCREGVPIKEIPHEFAKDRTEFVHYYLEPEFDFMPKCNGHLIRKLIERG